MKTRSCSSILVTTLFALVVMNLAFQTLAHLLCREWAAG
jgi:hypothetical protein